MNDGTDPGLTVPATPVAMENSRGSPRWKVTPANLYDGTIDKLKEKFDVSWEAMINRLDELGIQNKTLTKNVN
ncbi:hypothetical protein [Neomoorella mulderi]|uniref:Uncharacterized protein n=1 Tax=Moorella mulderi DSM 14980 TaxID=1122241 RepID=A0A151AVV6_9FIRM|nr:hypothetical protein [Moorella mulderi]KYH31768.1 hypothetical protein MOMUL_21340 [Moorella mulderi DSM 14980]